MILIWLFSLLKKVEENRVWQEGDTNQNKLVCLQSCFTKESVFQRKQVILFSAL